MVMNVRNMSNRTTLVSVLYSVICETLFAILIYFSVSVHSLSLATLCSFLNAQCSKLNTQSSMLNAQSSMLNAIM